MRMYSLPCYDCGTANHVKGQMQPIDSENPSRATSHQPLILNFSDRAFGGRLGMYDPCK